MKKFCIKVLYLFIILTFFIPEKPFAQNVNALVLLSHHYGPNYFFNRDDFEDYGWNITTVGVTPTISPDPLFPGIPVLTVDILVSEITDITNFDVLAIMPASWRSLGSNVYNDIMNDTTAMNFVKTAVDSGLIVSTTCAGPRILAAANRLNGVQIVLVPGTGFQFLNECLNAGAIYLGSDHPPVIDGNIVTSVRDQYYHVQNSQAIMTALENRGRNSKRKFQHKESESTTIIVKENSEKSLLMNTFGGIESEGGKSICETNDGGFIICGYTYSFGFGNSDVYLIKTDSEGNGEWANTYGGSGWEYGYSVCQTSEGDYIMTGYTTSFGAGSKDLYIVKTDSMGDTIWTKTYGDSGIDVGRSICETNDGNFIISGYTESFGSGEDDIWLLKINTSGDTLWTRLFGSNRAEMSRQVKTTANNELIIVGATGSPSLSSGNQDIYLIKTNSEGNEQWWKTYGNTTFPPFDWGNSVIQTNNGGFALIGNSNINTPLNLMMVKTDSVGNETWRRNYGGSYHDYGTSICESNDGGFIICGSIKPYSDCLNDAYVIKTDSYGNKIWEATYGGSGSDWSSSGCLTNDGNYYVITGHTNSFSSGAGAFDVWFIKIPASSMTSIEKSVSNHSNFNLKQNYPNPFNPSTTINYQLLTASKVILKIYNILGQEIRELANEFQTAGYKSVVWDGTDDSGRIVNSGVYIYHIQARDKIQSKKMLLLK